MIGKYATLNSVLRPTTGSRHNLYGEIVGLYQDEKRFVEKAIGSESITFRTIVLIRLGTFDKDRVYEVPLECIRMYDSLESAKEAVDIR